MSCCFWWCWTKLGAKANDWFYQNVVMLTQLGSPELFAQWHVCSIYSPLDIDPLLKTSTEFKPGHGILLASKDNPPNQTAVVARMTSRVNQLHDELALESVTNIEFEQSSSSRPVLLELFGISGVDRPIWEKWYVSLKRENKNYQSVGCSSHPIVNKSP